MLEPNPTIYVVDDDPVSRKFLQRLLVDAGFHVEVFFSAEDFLSDHHLASSGAGQAAAERPHQGAHNSRLLAHRRAKRLEPLDHRADKLREFVQRLSRLHQGVRPGFVEATEPRSDGFSGHQKRRGRLRHRPSPRRLDFEDRHAFHWLVQGTSLGRDPRQARVLDPQFLQGRVTWRPGVLGNYQVTLAVSDGVNPAVTQSYTLNVLAPVALNEPPEIISSPTGPAVRNKPWQYAAQATDPNGDTIDWSLAPVAGAESLPPQLNSATGLVTWTPLAAGSFDFQLIR